MKRPFLLRLLALLAVFALVAAACGSDDDDTDASGDETEAAEDTGGEDEAEEEEPAEEEEEAMADDTGRGTDLLLLQWQAPSQANSMLSSGTKDLLAASLVLEPLAKYAPDGSLVAALATEIPTVDNGGVAADFTSITWTLRDDIMWSDGTPFTSDDVVFSWEYCSDELTGCTADFTTVDKVEAVDDYTVMVTFTDPQPFPYLDFVGYTENVLQRAQFQDCIGEGASACTDQNFAPVGTGPYMVTELKPEDTVTYAANPNYRGVADGQPFFQTVTIKGGGEAEAAARSVLEIGEADYAWNLQVAPEILAPMESAGNGQVVTSFTANVEHINLNQTNPHIDPPSEYVADGSNNHPILFDNFEFARALSLAIDRDALVAVGYGPTGSPTCTLWPVGDQQSTTHDWCKTRDVAQANEILDGLGYEDSDGDGTREFTDGTPLSFTYVTSTNAVRQSNQDIIKANWAEIGIDVEMSNQDASLFFDGTSASDFSIWKFFSDMEMFTNGSTTPDPVSYFNSWIISEIPTAADGWPASGNMPRMQSTEFDDLWLATSQLSASDPAYVGNVQQLQDLMIETGAIIPLIHRGNVSGIHNSISGFGEPNGWDSEYWNIQEWSR